MAVRTTTTYAAILAAVEARILAANVVTNANSVFVSLANDEDILTAAPGENFVVLAPRFWPFDQPLAAGAGLNAVGIDSMLDVAVWVRLLTDQQGEDQLWFTDATLGLLTMWEKSLTALHLFDPVNGSGDWILSEPMRCLRTASERRAQRDTGWGKVWGTFEVRYRAALP